MTNQRLSYSDAQSFPDMAVDCHEVEHNLHLPHRGPGSFSSVGSTESFSDAFVGDVTPTRVRPHSRYDVPDDLAHLAEGMELHID